MPDYRRPDPGSRQYTSHMERRKEERPGPKRWDRERPDRYGRPRTAGSARQRGIDPVWHRDVGQPILPEHAPTHRLFIALKLPEAAIEEIGTFINTMPTMAGQNVRWTPRENVHLTLLFLGDTPVSMIDKIGERIMAAAANTSPFTLRLGDPGAFPSFHSPKILWVGLAGEVRKLVQLQGRIEGEMRSIGFEPEHRPFRPHITVGRTVRDLTRQYAGDVGFSWRRSELPDVRAEIRVTEVELLKSTLRTDGSVYGSVRTVPLGS